MRSAGWTRFCTGFLRTAGKVVLWSTILSVTTGSVGTCNAYNAWRALISNTAWSGGSVWEGVLTYGARHERTVVGAYSSRFGSSVALCDLRFAVGDPTSSLGRGSVAFFCWNEGGCTLPTVDLAHGKTSHAYGSSVDWAAEWLIIGAPTGAYFDERNGTVYAVNVETGEIQVLQATDGEPGDQFGCAVALGYSAGLSVYVVVGARMDDEGAGSAYVFRLVDGTWTEYAKITPSDAAPGDEFGASVAARGNTIAVGAPRADTSEPDAGKVYVFVREGAAFPPVGPFYEGDTELGRAGTALALDEYSVFVGAPGEHAGRGQVHVRAVSTGGFRSVLRHPDGISDVIGSELGASLSLSADHIAVGAPLWGPTSTGLVHVYGLLWGGDADDWEFRTTVHCPEPGALAEFGRAVALQGMQLAVGAPGAATGAFGGGKVYTFTVTYAGRDYKSAAEPGNRYLVLRPTGDVHDALVRIPRTLRPPFRARLTAGAFGESDVAGLSGARFGTGVEADGTDPREFCEVMGEFVAGGLEVSVVTHDGVPGDPIRMDGARCLDISVAHDGTDLVLSASPRGEGPLQEIARVPAPPAGTTFTPIIVLEDVPTGGEIGFDDPVVENGSLPGGVDDPADLIYQAVEHQLAAQGYLDALRTAPGPAEALMAAEVMLLRADDALQGQLAAAKAGGMTGPKRALKKVKKALKKTARASKLLGKGRPASKVLRQIDKALKNELRAVVFLTE